MTEDSSADAAVSERKEVTLHMAWIFVATIVPLAIGFIARLIWRGLLAGGLACDVWIDHD